MGLSRDYLSGFEYDTTTFPPVQLPVHSSAKSKSDGQQKTANKRSTKSHGNKNSSLAKVFDGDEGDSERVQNKINLFRWWHWQVA